MCYSACASTGNARLDLNGSKGNHYCEVKLKHGTHSTWAERRDLKNVSSSSFPHLVHHCQSCPFFFRALRQVITGSHDCQIKLWDLIAGKAMTTLTHHKKAVRSLRMHPKEFSFVSAAADNMKKWQVRKLLRVFCLLSARAFSWLS